MPKPKSTNKDHVRLLGGLIALRRVGGDSSSNPTRDSGGGSGGGVAPARAEGNVYPPTPRRRTQRRRQSRGRVRPAAAAAPVPGDWATSQAIVLVPNPDGSWVAQPANYWQDGSQPGGGTGGT